MKGKITAVLFILVFLLVVAVVFTFLTSLDRRREAAANQPSGNEVVVTENTPTPAPVTPAPQQAAALPGEAQGQSTPVTAAPATPAPTPRPEAAVMETPASDAMPAPGGVADMGRLLGSGSFSSRTGAHIDIRADWEARVSGDTDISVRVTVYLNSYSIYVNALPNCLNIGLNGQYVALDSPAISYDSNTALLTTELGSQSFTVQLPAGSSRDLDLQAEWHWGGTYGGEYIPVIECGGTFTLNR
jgi:hypothetical protein